MMTLLSILVLLVAAGLPALIWLIFVRAEDCHPGPIRLLLYTFAVGALVSLPALAVQLLLQRLLPESLSSALVLITGLAVIEEVFKFIAVYWAINKNLTLDEPIDAMVYTIAGALGFATVENLFIIGRSLDLANLSSLGESAETLLLRFVGATLLHMLAGAVVGYYWARGRLVLRGLKDRVHTSFAECLVVGLVLASVIHIIFNYLVLSFQDQNNLLYPSLFLIGVTFFVIEDFERLRDRPDATLPPGINVPDA